MQPWTIYSTGPPPANAICISELSHLTTPSDVTQKIRELRSKFSYSDGRVTATVDIDSVDIKLDKKGAYMGLCRVVFRGKYPLQSSSGERGGSARQKQPEADIKAGEVIAANQFAQHVARVLNNTRIGPAYKVQNERARVILDGTGAKLKRLEQEIADKKSGKVPSVPVKPATPVVKQAAPMPPPTLVPKPLPPPPSVAQVPPPNVAYVPAPNVTNGYQMHRPGPAGLANGTGFQASLYGNAETVRPSPAAGQTSYLPGPHLVQQNQPVQLQYPFDRHQQRFPARPAYNTITTQTQHDPRLIPPKPPVYLGSQHQPFWPKNPHYHVNLLLQKKYQAELQAYQEEMQRQARKSATRATAGDDFIDAPFKPARKTDSRPSAGGATRKTQIREAETQQTDTFSETSSDSEVESEIDQDLVIDPKTRSNRHKGRVKSTTTPVKSASAAAPANSPLAPGLDAITKELRKNGCPYIFVPKLAAIEGKEPAKRLQQYFKGCHDVSRASFCDAAYVLALIDLVVFYRSCPTSSDGTCCSKRNMMRALV